MYFQHWGRLVSPDGDVPLVFWPELLRELAGLPSRVSDLPLLGLASATDSLPLPFFPLPFPLAGSAIVLSCLYGHEVREHFPVL